ncbi:MAG: hypothetical protein KDA28_17495, partial [Phycisphaerales bacterium]|nr:hypothetical protein [Phycisphaerales bacterium]
MDIIGIVVWSLAASCTPGWDTSIGDIGPSTGYVGAFASWQGEVYVGGSFDDCGNAHAALLSLWNPETNTWRRAGGGLDRGNTNGFVASIAPFDDGSGERLYVGGFFRDAANVEDTQSIAAWDGSDWHSLGAQLVPGEAVWAIRAGDLGNGP